VGAHEVFVVPAVASLNMARIVGAGIRGLRIAGLAKRNAIAAAGRSDMMTPLSTAETGGGGGRRGEGEGRYRGALSA
jgi:hypothetical protein